LQSEAVTLQSEAEALLSEKESMKEAFEKNLKAKVKQELTNQAQQFEVLVINT